MTTPNPHHPAASIADRVQVILDDVLAAQHVALTAVSDELSELTATAGAFLSGGKRLRAAFCYWGWRSAGATDDDAPIRVGAALELFQAAALVHDDLIDASDTRRGAPSVHRRFETTHEASGWSGSAADFGRAAAVLIGDLLLTWSDEVFAASSPDAAMLGRGRPIFDRMRTEVGGGQYLDVLEQARGHLTDDPDAMADRALRVVRYKSARYSVEHPLLLGATMGDADPAVRDALSRYGAALGTAFQLRDDVLGVFGDPAVTGKPAGDDLREGKRTVLVARALAGGSSTQRDALTTLVGRGDLDDDGVSTLREIITDTGALAAVEAMVDDGVRDATTALDEADVSSEGHTALTTLIDAATARTT